MSYQNITFLASGLKAIDNKYRKWFSTNSAFTYESADIEKHYKTAKYDLPDGNKRRWDYLIIKLNNGNLTRVVFAEPHPIKNSNVKEVLEKLHWLKYQISNDKDLQHFESTINEYVWIYKCSSISPNSKEYLMCKKMNLQLSSIPFQV